MSGKDLKVAIVHDWLKDMGGAEKVLGSLLSIYPNADLYTLVATEGAKKQMGVTKVTESFLCHLPFGRSHYRYYLSLFPLAIEGFNLSNYDIVISCSSSVAKGVLTHSNQLHICYCHSPARYVWDLTWQYLKEKGLTSRWNPLAVYVRRVMHKFRIWDVTASNRVDCFVANSKNIARRIRKVYARDADVIYPPVNVKKFSMLDDESARGDYYVTASRMVSYKRMDIIVSAFGQMPDKKLIVIGSGPEEDRLKGLAKGNVTFLGRATDDVLKGYLQKAKAFVFAAEEDFGIAPLEAQACGTPVIAYGKGGSLETVCGGKSGIFFDSQTPDSVVGAVMEFERIGGNKTLTPQQCREWAERFSEDRFKEEIISYVDKKYSEFQERIKL